MTTTYVGLYHPASPQFTFEELREHGAVPEYFREKIRGFEASLPSTCKLIGSWAGDNVGAPGVMVVEAEGWDDLAHINNYYLGYLVFGWRPTATGGVPRT